MGILLAAAIIDFRSLRIPNKLIVFACFIWVAERTAVFLLSGSLDCALNFANTSSQSFTLSNSELSISSDSIFRTISNFPVFHQGVSVSDGLWGAVVVGGASLLVALVYEAMRGKPSMGGGDVKLLFVCGLNLGLFGGLVCVLLASVFFVAFSLVARHIGWQPICVREKLGASKSPAEKQQQNATTQASAVKQQQNDNLSPYSNQPSGLPFGPSIALAAFLALLLL